MQQGARWFSRQSKSDSFLQRRSMHLRQRPTTMRFIVLFMQTIALASGTVLRFYCNDPAAANYDEGLNSSTSAPKNMHAKQIHHKCVDVYAAPWTCEYPAYGCTDPAADNFVVTLNGTLISAPSMCQFGGCNDSDATNFNAQVSTHKLQKQFLWKEYQVESLHDSGQKVLVEVQVALAAARRCFELPGSARLSYHRNGRRQPSTTALAATHTWDAR
eukprot:170472-Pleurochrysis_carterae.AAC.2